MTAAVQFLLHGFDFAACVQCLHFIASSNDRTELLNFSHPVLIMAAIDEEKLHELMDEICAVVMPMKNGCHVSEIEKKYRWGNSHLKYLRDAFEATWWATESRTVNLV